MANLFLDRDGTLLLTTATGITWRGQRVLRLEPTGAFTENPNFRGQFRFPGTIEGLDLDVLADQDALNAYLNSYSTAPARQRVVRCKHEDMTVYAVLEGGQFHQLSVHCHSCERSWAIEPESIKTIARLLSRTKEEWESLEENV